MKVSITTWHSQQNQETYMQIVSIKRGLLFYLAHTYETFHTSGSYAFVMEIKQMKKLQRLLTPKMIVGSTLSSSLRIKCSDGVKRKLVIRKIGQDHLGMGFHMDEYTFLTNGEDLDAILRFIRDQVSRLSVQEDEDHKCQERVMLYSPQSTTQFEYEIIDRRFHIVMMQKQLIEGKVRGGAIYEFYLDIQVLLQLQDWMKHMSSHSLSEDTLTITLSGAMDIDLKVTRSERGVQLDMIKKDVKQCQFSLLPGAELQQFVQYVHEAIYCY
ncbi:hypothetical protein J2W91_001128 [Paenibacillus amylolyticus]|uniref:Uncharacterized protein n=1 Tax=Paenibacillus amylolyticus TaxID=1451 RepID=A0AAP5GZP8_PAEAM|nr:hypothetical protein [Paenibacillus amylolyticus]MDR6722680.1 hypothetical protein [Paenibacillus amylolyticus]